MVETFSTSWLALGEHHSWVDLRDQLKIGHMTYCSRFPCHRNAASPEFFCPLRHVHTKLLKKFWKGKERKGFI